MKNEEEVTMNTTDKIAGFAHETVDSIADASHHASAAFDEKTELVRNCQRYVRENPVTSLGLAVAGGFLLSRLLSGR